MTSPRVQRRADRCRRHQNDFIGIQSERPGVFWAKGLQQEACCLHGCTVVCLRCTWPLWKLPCNRAEQHWQRLASNGRLFGIQCGRWRRPALRYLAQRGAPECPDRVHCSRLDSLPTPPWFEVLLWAERADHATSDVAGPVGSIGIGPDSLRRCAEP